MARSDGGSRYSRDIRGKKKLRLDDIDPADTRGMDKTEALVRTDDLGRELSELENLLTYAGTHALLVVLQGRDASGKDGAARKVLAYTNIQNAYVAPFKAPTEDERAHDFLWRVHKVVPRRGHMSMFNRSHYEDVLAARIHKLVPKEVWEARYDHINAFERLLVQSDVILLKLYLHIGREEQYERLVAREKDPRTAWKLNPGDWQELPLWDELTAAYEDVFKLCSPPEAPWILIPADKKWFRNLAVMERMVLALRPYRKQWLATLKAMGKTKLKEIHQLRAQVEAERKKK